MTKANQIRALATEGLSVADIARKMDIRYQHAYHVLSRSGMLANVARRSETYSKPSITTKPTLQIDELINAGFEHGADWLLTEQGILALNTHLPKECAVYAMVKKGQVMYVGVATMGLAKRVRFYAKPGKRQKTSQRLNAQIIADLNQGDVISLYYAMPADTLWNSLPIHGCAGLELGLIKKYSLPWNIRSN